MSNKGLAIVLASAIYAGNKDVEWIEADTPDRIYTALDSSDMFTSDDAKADVYAQLAEQLTEATTFKEAISIIEYALDNTQKGLIE